MGIQEALPGGLYNDAGAIPVPLVKLSIPKATFFIVSLSDADRAASPMPSEILLACLTNSVFPISSPA